MPSVRSELGTTFVEREGVAECFGNVIVHGEREDTGDDGPDGRHCVEHTKELDRDRSAECSFVCGAESDHRLRLDA